MGINANRRSLMGRVAETLLYFALVALLVGCQWSTNSCFGDCEDWNDRRCASPETYTVLDSASPVSIDPGGAYYAIKVLASGTLVQFRGHGVACEMRIEGNNNLLHFETTRHTVRTCRFIGNDNTIERPSGMALTCEDSGVGNTLLVY